MVKNRPARFPCGVCTGRCVDECIRCGLCSMWFHISCQSVSVDELSQWTDLMLDYVCLSCRSVCGDGSEFDFLMGMHRLQKAAGKGIDHLKSAVLREKLFKVNFSIVSDNDVVAPAKKIDLTGQEVLTKFGSDIHGDVISTTGNGDCLFNAASLLLFGDDQLCDMKRNCVGEDCSVLGVDRTFNLGRFFVTTVSYKNRTVLSRRTADFPIMLGPCMIHFDAEETTYSKFFSHLSDRIGNAKLIIGSDEERSMTNALQKKFPNSDFLLCTKHIKDNIRRHLEETGTSLKDRETILKIIFGEDGIVHADDDSDFEIQCDRLDPYLDINTKFKTYWEKHMYKKIRDYVFKPLSTKLLTRLWTNNNSESMNHKLKAAVDWDKNKFPELIEKIGQIMKNQIVHLKCALYGKGDFKLTSTMQNNAELFRGTNSMARVYPARKTR